MTILSTSCKCSACTKKYGCPMYKKMVKMQNLTLDYADSPDLVIRFQVEDCKQRMVEACASQKGVGE